MPPTLAEAEHHAAARRGDSEPFGHPGAPAQVADRRALWIAAPTVALLVLAACLAAFPADFLLGSAPHWMRATGDPAQHVIGGLYFVADAWRLPLLYIPTLGMPEGANAGLTDSIPIAALIAKAGRSLWGTHSTYVPVWVTFCWIAQGVAGTVVLYVLGVRRATPLVLGGLLLVFTPVLLARIGHAALCAHFLLLLALATHVAAIRAPARNRIWLFYLPLLLFALLTHIYLLAMVAGFAFATLLDGLWTETITVRTVLLRLLAMALPIVPTMWLLGYLGLGPVPLKPYGQWPFNLAAPFVPGWSLLTGMTDEPPMIGFESYAWAGVGMLLLMAVALVNWRTRLRALSVRHGATVTLMIAALVFGASFAVRFGPWTILGLPLGPVREAALARARGGNAVHRLLAALTLEDWVQAGLYALCLALLGGALVWHLRRHRRTRALRFVLAAAALVAVATVVTPHAVALVISNFQGSARFLWMPLYLLAVLAIAGVWRSCRPGVAIAWLAVALVLQVADTEPLWARLRTLATEPSPGVADAALIEPAMAAAREVVLVPTYLCAYAEGLAAEPTQALVNRITDLEMVAARSVVPINSVRMSRMSAVDQPALRARCDAERAAAEAGRDQPGRLTVVLQDAPVEADLRRTLAADPACTQSAVGMVCRGR